MLSRLSLVQTSGAYKGTMRTQCLTKAGETQRKPMLPFLRVTQPWDCFSSKMLLFLSRIFTCLTLNRLWHFCQGIGHTTAILKGDGSILAALALPPFQAFPAMQAGHRDSVQEGQTFRNSICSPKVRKEKNSMVKRPRKNKKAGQGQARESKDE